MSDPRPILGHIVVAGDGQLGVLVAIALRRALPATQVTVIGTPPDAASLADRIGTALPFTNRLHDRLGIEEDQLIRRAGASHRLVTRYAGFAGDNAERPASYGIALDTQLRSVFAREWGGRPRVPSDPPAIGSVAEALAAGGRFAQPDGTADSPLAEVDYGLRWHIESYRAYLIEIAQRIGVAYRPGAIVVVQYHDSETVSAVQLDTGDTIPADFFVDCTGPSATLLSQQTGYAIEDWSDHLPIRSLVIQPSDTMRLSLADRVVLNGMGWTAEIFGRDGVTTVSAFASPVDSATSPSLDVIPLHPGRATNAWIGNVVALGDAAARFEPLGWLNLDLAHRQLALLVEMLPGDHLDPLERAEFNRRAALAADGTRMVVASHYHAEAATAVFGTLAQCPRLALTLDQFVRRGRIPNFDDMPLLPQEWATHLTAAGYVGGQSALGMSSARDRLASSRQTMTERCARALAQCPPYPEYLRIVVESGAALAR